MLKAPFLQADDYFAVTPSDSADLSADAANPDSNAYTIAALFVGDTSPVDIVIVSPYDSDASRPVTFSVIGPIFLPLVAKRVMATGTTATDIIALVKKL